MYGAREARMWTFFFLCFSSFKTLHDAYLWLAYLQATQRFVVERHIALSRYLYLCTSIVVVGDKHTPRAPAKTFIIIIIISSAKNKSPIYNKEKTLDSTCMDEPSIQRLTQGQKTFN